MVLWRDIGAEGLAKSHTMVVPGGSAMREVVSGRMVVRNLMAMVIVVVVRGLSGYQPGSHG